MFSPWQEKKAAVNDVTSWMIITKSENFCATRKSNSYAAVLGFVNNVPVSNNKCINRLNVYRYLFPQCYCPL
jgi:hypothetical protein